MIQPNYLLADWSCHATSFSPTFSHRPYRKTTPWQHAFSDILLRYSSFPRLSLLSLLSNTLPGPSASEVTTLWRYTNLIIIIIIICLRWPKCLIAVVLVDVDLPYWTSKVEHIV